MHLTPPLITAISMGLVLAFLFGTLAQRFKLSPLVGYLVAGVIAGVFNKYPNIGPNLDPHIIEQLAELGVVLLMFGVGLHFSTKDLMSVKNISLPGAVVQIVLATVLGAVLAYWGINWGIQFYNESAQTYNLQNPDNLRVLINFKYSLGSSIVFGLALSTASTVVLIRALEERSVLTTERGKIAVGWLIVEDVFCVLLLVILPILAPMMGGSVPGASETVTTGGSIVVKLLTTACLVAAFVAIMLTVGKKLIPLTLEKVAGLGSKELFTLSVLAIALGVALGAAYLFGVSLALGAFFAGMMLNESELSHEAAADSLPLRDAFAVLFFVSVGMQLELKIFVEHPILLLLTVLIIVIGKSIGAYALVRVFRYSRETALTVAISLAQIGEFAFIIVSLGFTLHLVDPIGKSLVLSAAIVSIVLNPFLFKLLDRWLEKNKETADIEEDDKKELEDLQIPEAGHTIIVGFGQVGNELAKIIESKNLSFVVVEADSYIAERAHDKGIPIITGNAAAESVLKKANPQTAAALFVTTPHPFESAVIIERVNKMNPAAIIVARAETDAAVDYLLNQGAHGVVMEKKELAYSMAEMAVAGERLAQRGMWPPAPSAEDTQRDVSSDGGGEAYVASDSDNPCEQKRLDVEEKKYDDQASPNEHSSESSRTDLSDSSDGSIDV